MRFARVGLFLPIFCCLNKSIKLIINYLIGPLLFVVLTWSLYRQIIRQPDLAIRWAHIKDSWLQPAFWLVVILMFVNWGIEARKWQLLLRPLQKFSLLYSLKAVFAGCSITMLTPNRIGEYGGRILYVDEAFRIRAISLTILGSMSQLAVTMLSGTIALAVLIFSPAAQKLEASSISWIFNGKLIFLAGAGLIVIMLLFFRVHFLIVLIGRVPFLRRMVRHIRVLDFFNGKQLLRIFSLSFSRYLVFILQYVLLLQVMDVRISFPLMLLLLAVFYMLMVLAPSIGFTELPVRAGISVLLLGVFTSNSIGIQAAALGIWLINLVAPAIIGSVLLLGIKIMKEK